MLKKIGKVLGIVVIVFIVVFLAYVSNYSKADEVATKIYEENGGLDFLGNNPEYGFIIYPGGKVDEIAYVGLAKKLSEKGYTSVVVDFPFNIGFLGINRADEVIKKYPNIENWVIVGHSLGGVSAAVYADESDDKIDGLVLLASYSTKDLKDNDIEVLSLVGSNDTVVNMESAKEALINYKDDSQEFIIEGGNHAGFGNYGLQKGDGENTIGNEEQQRITVEEITKFIKNID